MTLPTPPLEPRSVMPPSLDPDSPPRSPLDLLRLLQLSNATLPVGAYSYSEGLETLIDQGILTNPAQVQDWLDQELRYGSIRVEAAIVGRAYQATQQANWDQVRYWQAWWGATRDAAELYQQSLGMGQALTRLLRQLDPTIAPLLDQIDPSGTACHYAIAVGVAAAHWQLPLADVVSSYLFAWVSNLVTAGVRLVPLGQTAGQQMLWALQATIVAATPAILACPDEELTWSGWGAAIASMQHETLYSRLFRS